MTQLKDHNPMQLHARTRGTDFVALLVFIIPCMQFIQIKAIGVLNGSDVLLLATFIYMVSRGKIRIETRKGKWFVALCSLWLVSQCVTDIVRHSAFVDYARGWSNVGMTLVNFAVIYTLLHARPGRLVIFGWGYVVGGFLYFMISPDIYASGSPWKFGIGFPASLAVFLLISRKECRGHWPASLSASIGIFNLAMGFRSMGGICLVVALYLLLTRMLRKRSASSTKLKTKSVVLMIAASIILGMVGVLWAYQYAAGAGILGEDARSKYEDQSSGQYGILLGGRVEALGYIPAIYDSPLLGHGSWAKDPTYLLAEHQALALMGYSTAQDYSETDIEEGYIPTHSCLFGAWVDAGILGALFWGWLFVLTAKALLRAYPPEVAILPLMCFVAFLLLWDILFSPYGARARIVMPYYVVILMTCMGMVPYKATRAAVRLAKMKVNAVSSSNPN